MHKNKKFFYLTLSLFFLGSFFVVSQADAAVQYTLLENIPGFSSISGSDLPGYVKAIYKLALIIVTLSAVVMLSIGGFMYITSAGNTSSMGTAKGIIFDSIIGLVIALVSWVVLYVINPDMINIRIQHLAPIPAKAPDALPKDGAYAQPPTADAKGYAEQILNNSNIGKNSSGSCQSPSGTVSPLKNLQDTKDGKQTAACYAGPTCASQGAQGCADNAVRLSETMLKALATVGQQYSFTITSLAGGPHALNSAHYQGRGVDIVPANWSQAQAILDAMVANGAKAPAGNAGSMCEKGGKNVGCAPGSGANHIHFVF